MAIMKARIEIESRLRPNVGMRPKTVITPIGSDNEAIIPIQPGIKIMRKITRRIKPDHAFDPSVDNFSSTFSPSS
jgi:hypothetical protein